MKTCYDKMDRKNLRPNINAHTHALAGAYIIVLGKFLKSRIKRNTNKDLINTIQYCEGQCTPLHTRAYPNALTHTRTDTRTQTQRQTQQIHTRKEEGRKGSKHIIGFHDVR